MPDPISQPSANIQIQEISSNLPNDFHLSKNNSSAFKYIDVNGVKIAFFVPLSDCKTEKQKIDRLNSYSNEAIKSGALLAVNLGLGKDKNVSKVSFDLSREGSLVGAVKHFSDRNIQIIDNKYFNDEFAKTQPDKKEKLQNQKDLFERTQMEWNKKFSATPIKDDKAEYREEKVLKSALKNPTNTEENSKKRVKFYDDVASNTPLNDVKDNTQLTTEELEKSLKYRNDARKELENSLKTLLGDDKKITNFIEGFLKAPKRNNISNFFMLLNKFHPEVEVKIEQEKMDELEEMRKNYNQVKENFDKNMELKFGLEQMKAWSEFTKENSSISIQGFQEFLEKREKLL